jgi:hypothetical protein
MFALMVALLMGGCAGLPGQVIFVPYHSHQGGRVNTPYLLELRKEVGIKVNEDEQGLVSFSAREHGLSEGDLEWILERVKGLKERCPNGSIKKSDRISYSERSAPNTRQVRGDISVNIEYHCNRNKPGKDRRNQGDWS